MKKIISLVLVFILSATALFACGKPTETSTNLTSEPTATQTYQGKIPPDTTLSPVNRPAHSTPAVDYSGNGKVELVNNGNVIFNFNYNTADNASVRTVEALNELISASCNRSLGSTDGTAENVFAVINSRSSYPKEFSAFVDKMGDGDYMVCTTDSIIVLVGDGDENLWIGANFFAKNLMGYDCENPTDIVNGAVLAVPSGVEYIAEGTLDAKYDALTISGSSIRNFVVVCPAEIREAGAALVRYIGLKTGIEPQVFTEDQDINNPVMSANEIVFVLDGSLADNEYKCSAERPNKIVLSAANPTTAMLAAYKFIDTYVGMNGSGDAEITVASFDEKAAFDHVDMMTDDYTSLIMNTIDKYYTVSVNTDELADLLALDNGIDYMDKELYEYTSNNKTYSMLLDCSEGVQISLKRKISTTKGTDTTTVTLIAEDGHLPCFASKTVKNIVTKSFASAEHSGSERLVLNSSYKVCPCASCKGTYDSYFALVSELASSTPDVQYTVLAYNATVTPPSAKLAANVSVDIFTTKTCCAHALDDAHCETNKAFADALRGWKDVCGTVNVYDTSNDYAYFPSTFPDFSVLARNAAFYKSVGISSLSYVFSPEITMREFGALREYLISNLLMKAGMTDEDYEKMLDGGIDALYGIGAENIRKYIDLFAYSAADHYTAFDKPSAIIPINRTVDANGKKQYDVKLAASLYKFLDASAYKNETLEGNPKLIAKLLYSAYEEDCDYYITHALPQFSEWFQYDIDTLDRTRVANEILAEMAK